MLKDIIVLQNRNHQRAKGSGSPTLFIFPRFFLPMFSRLIERYASPPLGGRRSMMRRKPLTRWGRVRRMGVLQRAFERDASHSRSASSASFSEREFRSRSRGCGCIRVRPFSRASSTTRSNTTGRSHGGGTCTLDTKRETKGGTAWMRACVRAC